MVLLFVVEFLMGTNDQCGYQYHTLLKVNLLILIYVQVIKYALELIWVIWILLRKCGKGENGTNCSRLFLGRGLISPD